MFLLSLIIPASVFVAGWFGGSLLWLPLFLVLIVHPLVDYLAPASRKFSTEPSASFSWLLWAYVLIQLALIVWVLGLHYVGSQAVLMAVNLGLATGAIGIPVAHELIHRRSRFEKALGLSLWAMVNYMHYAIEHLYVHHRLVATPDDPVTARRGETVYAFGLRTVMYVFICACQVEARRLSGRTVFLNRVLQYVLLELAVNFAVFSFWGARGLMIFLVQSVVAILLLVIIDYVEHYGLVRRQLANGKYEPISALDSWDTDRTISNFFFFNLGRHSHHHLKTADPYEILEVQDQAPLLPLGLSGMFLIAVVPPLWMRVVDPLIKAR